jgi:thioredoxin 1
MSHAIVKITDADFPGTVLEGRRPSVVDFWATWCAPCRQLDGILEEVARSYEGKVSFYKVDVNESAGTASRYAVRSIPTLLFFDGGEVVDQAIGAVSREDIEEKLRQLVSGG